MPLHITFKGLDQSDAVEARIVELSSKLARICPEISRCEVRIETPHRHQRQGARFRVCIELVVPGRDIVASHDPDADDSHVDVYVALRDAFDAARRQLEDYLRTRREAFRGFAAGEAHT